MNKDYELVEKDPEIPAATGTPPPLWAGYNTEGRTEQGYLLDYLRSARKHSGLITGITLIATVFAILYMSRQPDIYVAAARVQVNLENSNPALGISKSSSIIVNSPVNDPAYFNTQLEILTSPGLLRRVVKALDLEHNRDFFNPQAGKKNSQDQTIERVAVNSSIAPATSQEDLEEINRLTPYVEALRVRLAVRQVRMTRLIDIQFYHSEPQVAAKVVNAVADAFVLSNLEIKTETNATAGDFLQKRIAELQGQIRNGEERLINYARGHQILSLDSNQNTVVERLAALNRQLLEAENDRKAAEAAYRVALAPGAADAMAEGAATASAEGRLAELRQRRAQLLVENTEKWPDVKEINEQIAVLEKQAQETRDRATSVVLTNLETRYRQALAREQALRTSFAQQQSETLTQNEAAINYRIIQQEIETNKGLLEGLLQRSKENDVMMAGTPNNIRVSDYASVPKAPVGPARLRGVMMALALSLVLSVVFARFLDRLDDTVHSTDDVEEVLHLPALAVIPSVGMTRRRLLSATNVLQKRNGDGYPELLINAEARSPLAEAYRQLRTSVLLSTAGGAPKTLLVTSSLPAEGKTTTAINTTISLAQTGKSVLIIDADMRRPRLHSVFEMGNQHGLSTILSSEKDAGEFLPMIKKHEAGNLFVLTSGPVPPNPAELLGSEQMRRLITALEARFTHIVIDSPPVASFTDAVLLSSLVNGVLLVVHGGRSSRAVVRRSRKVLQEVGAKIFGVVLNNVTLRAHDYYYQSYYRESYYMTEVGADNIASKAEG